MKNLLTSSVAMTSPDKFQAEVETSELPATVLDTFTEYQKHKYSILFSLEYKSRDSYSRLIEFSPKFFYSNLVFE